MREFPFNIVEHFTKGLRPEDTFIHEEGYLEACFNMQPTSGGLEYFEGGVDAFSGGLSVDFPHPQFFRGRDISLLFGTTSVEEVNTNVYPWTKAAITTSTSIVSGGVWHFVDLGPSWYAFNGTCNVFRLGLGNLESTSSTTTFVDKNVTIQTGCVHKGRIYIGGFDRSDIWSNLPVDITPEWEGEAGLDYIDLTVDGPGSNWIMWSSIGGGDFPLWLLYPSGYEQLSLGPTKENIIHAMKRNEFGWAPLPFNGTVQMLKPLGDAVIAYGDEGIQAILPRGNKVGFRKISNLGILGRGAVGGDDNSHVFLDSRGALWELGGDLALRRLGYEEYLSAFPATSTTLTFKPSPKEVFICSPDKGFVLNSNGLAEHYQRITSGAFLNGDFYAVMSTQASTDIRVKTASHDNRRQGLKQLHDIQVWYEDITNLKVKVYFRYDHNSTYLEWGPTSVNPQGVVYPGVSGLNFKIEITGTPGTNPRLDGIEVRWNLVDKRAIRGVFAPE